MQPLLLDTGDLVRSIEALLFVASESLSIKTLAKLTSADEADVTVALQTLDEQYAERGIVVREVVGGYRFAASPMVREVVEAYLMPPKSNLSPAALETLAIVAYMQPATKGDIEGIRGVNVDSVLATLVDRRFLAEAGRKDVAGRPILYKTTPEFLEAFGLRSLEELPPVELDAEAPPTLPIATAASVARNGDEAAPNAAADDGAVQTSQPHEGFEQTERGLSLAHDADEREAVAAPPSDAPEAAMPSPDDPGHRPESEHISQA